jgi:hypothetical protein
VRAILADNDVYGQVEYLVALMSAEPWTEFWQELGLQLLRFEDLGLSEKATDQEVWRRCQAEAAVLITGNRNLSGPDSLEATIRAENSTKSLPVFTIADVNKLNASKAYAEKAAQVLLDYLLRIDALHGVGRMYIP